MGRAGFEVQYTTNPVLFPALPWFFRPVGVKIGNLGETFGGVEKPPLTGRGNSGIVRTSQATWPSGLRQLIANQPSPVRIRVSPLTKDVRFTVRPFFVEFCRATDGNFPRLAKKSEKKTGLPLEKSGEKVYNRSELAVFGCQFQPWVLNCGGNEGLKTKGDSPLFQ